MFISNSPVYCYGELLSLVQTMKVFQDSKTFVDMPMIAEPGQLVYHAGIYNFCL